MQGEQGGRPASAPAGCCGPPTALSAPHRSCRARPAPATRMPSRAARAARARDWRQIEAGQTPPRYSPARPHCRRRRGPERSRRAQQPAVAPRSGPSPPGAAPPAAAPRFPRGGAVRPRPRHAVGGSDARRLGEGHSRAGTALVHGACRPGNRRAKPAGLASGSAAISGRCRHRTSRPNASTSTPSTRKVSCFRGSLRRLGAGRGRAGPPGAPRRAWESNSGTIANHKPHA